MTLTPSRFFALRTPLLPADAWPLEESSGVTDDEERRARIRALVGDPAIRDALFIASPELEEAIATWLDAPESERGRRVERSLGRYLTRMAWRPTPFGGFAGITVGVTASGARTQLELGARRDYRRHTRLDTGYLDALAQAITGDTGLRGTLRYRPNSSLYAAAGRMRYVEVRVTATSSEGANAPGTDERADWLRERSRAYSLADVADTIFLRAALERARHADGATVEDIVAAVVAAGSTVDSVAAARYVDDLIDNQLLIPVLSQPITGVEPMQPFEQALRASGERGSTTTALIADRLADVRAQLEAIDLDGLGVHTSRYRAIASALADLPAPPQINRLFQTDLFKPAVAVSLGDGVVAEIARGVEVLQRLRRTPPDPLARFKQRFLERFEGRSIPLPLALDDEAGVGLEASADVEPLLRGMALDAPSSDAEVTWGERENLLLAKLAGALAAREHEIVLSREDIDALANTIVPAPLPLSAGVAAMAALAARSADAIDRGDYLVHLSGVSGPSGAELLGRFCHGDAELCERVRAHLRAEEATNGDAIYAEIVHSPAGRIGNILLRPSLREHEIVFLGDSGAPLERQILVRDLSVAVEGDRVVLRLADGTRVIPRLTTAHNWLPRHNLATYRFLCMVQSQGTTNGAAWDWGPLNSSSFLPRVRTGRIVLSLARWRVRGDELRPFEKLHGIALVDTVRAWRTVRWVPRHAAIVEADNVLLVDLDSAQGIDALLRASQGCRVPVTLQEQFQTANELCVRGAEGAFVSEIVIPFLTTSSAVARPVAAQTTPRPRAPATSRTYAPGSEWLFAKLYTGPATADRVLRRAIAPLVAQARRDGWIDRWFFIRYQDPESHLRVRLHGDPRELREQVIPVLHDSTARLLGDGSVWRLDVSSYEPEIERYGGPDAMALIERVFEADSDAVLEMLNQSPALSRDDRWRAALYGIDRLHRDVGLDASTRRASYARSRDAYAGEHRPTPGLVRRMGERLRAERARLEALVADEPSAVSPALARAMQSIRARSERVAPIITELRALDSDGRLTTPLERITPSLAHMFANRLLRAAAREHELIVYDFLVRLYDAEAARGRAKAGPGAPSPMSSVAQSQPAPIPELA